MKVVKVKKGDAPGATALAAYWFAYGAVPKGVKVSNDEVKHVARKVTVAMLNAMLGELRANGFDPAGPEPVAQ